MYAITRKNIRIVTVFVFITVSQLALGIYFVTWAATKKSKAKFWTRKS